MITNPKIGIYGFFVGNECYYVGQSRNVNRRRCKHFWMLRRGSHENDRLQKSYNKYQELLVFRIIELVNSPEVLTERERFWIEQLQPKCNYMLPTTQNWTLSQEARRKISQKISGENNGMFGRTPWNKGLTKENSPIVAKYAKSLSEAKKGMQPLHLRGLMDDTIRRKISISHKGQKVSPEARRKMSEARKGKPIPWLQGRTPWNKGRKMPGSKPKMSGFKKTHPTCRDPKTGRFIKSN